MRSISDKFVEKIKTKVYVKQTVSENFVIYEIMWGKNGAEKHATNRNIIW
jgi:hypothetical protein